MAAERGFWTAAACRSPFCVTRARQSVAAALSESYFACRVGIPTWRPDRPPSQERRPAPAPRHVANEICLQSPFEGSPPSYSRVPRGLSPLCRSGNDAGGRSQLPFSEQRARCRGARGADAADRPHGAAASFPPSTPAAFPGRRRPQAAPSPRVARPVAVARFTAPSRSRLPWRVSIQHMRPQRRWRRSATPCGGEAQGRAGADGRRRRRQNRQGEEIGKSSRRKSPPKKSPPKPPPESARPWPLRPCSTSPPPPRRARRRRSRADLHVTPSTL